MINFFFLLRGAHWYPLNIFQQTTFAKYKNISVHEGLNVMQADVFLFCNMHMSEAITKRVQLGLSVEFFLVEIVLLNYRHVPILGWPI